MSGSKEKKDDEFYGIGDNLDKWNKVRSIQSDGRMGVNRPDPRPALDRVTEIWEAANASRQKRAPYLGGGASEGSAGSSGSILGTLALVVGAVVIGSIAYLFSLIGSLATPATTPPEEQIARVAQMAGRSAQLPATSSYENIFDQPVGEKRTFANLVEIPNEVTITGSAVYADNRVLRVEIETDQAISWDTLKPVSGTVRGWMDARVLWVNGCPVSVIAAPELSQGEGYYGASTCTP